jgi:hypothetical protein
MSDVLDLKGMISGFCDVGSHEGTRPKGWSSGTPMKTCPYWLSCGCDCHKEVTRMFEMTGQERIEVPNPEYRPYERTFWMPSLEDKLPEPQADVVEHDDHLQVTATGRTRKGSLETAVQKVVLAWQELPVAQRIEGLSVKDISEKVYENEGASLEKPPSLGAVAAVLDRWVKYGYVMLGTKPVRVVTLTKEGKENGLEWCRARFKNEKAA